MFTGMISEIGTVKSVRPRSYASRFLIDCGSLKEGLLVGDSVAVNGVCLTVTGVGPEVSFDAVGNTLEKTNIKRLRPGDRVNLEGAVELGDKMGGHMVSGHVDRVSVIKNSSLTSKGYALDISLLAKDRQLIMPRGSVAVDGVSLTVAETGSTYFRVYLIPHTLDKTILKNKRPGDHVNIEFDMVAKYVNISKSGNVSEEMLREHGFL